MVRRLFAYRAQRKRCQAASSQNPRRVTQKTIKASLTIYSHVILGLDHGVGHPWLPLDHATALQHLRQETCMDSTVMLRGHRGPRR